MNRAIPLLATIVCVLAYASPAAFGAPPTPAPQCHAVRGMRITLFGGVDDPDVLVWDNRDRLVAFAAGSSDTRKFLLPHALLARPGTLGVVQSCIAGMVHPKFRMEPEDAIGVQILSGTYHGRYGWVGASDIHGPGIPEPQEQW